ncbi:hypothetical protein TRFO_42345 [Tritrichomonas foetus]|uniref:Uncharacterized protein n=1 Tax=Tritrichomonas foetus TaxID=1144522 RepID=A0A1J4L1H7_9EUKA|nr:hypothetical protein TRFO_42345 [Tritrichomonas foetus]|eukprot:OHT15741.1 hypothetical protein TRFO_42345 [Tritrichomonas foetus]
MQINSLSISSDASNIAFSLSSGFAIYSLDPLNLVNKSNFQGQITNNAIPIPDSPVVVFNGSNGQSNFSDRSVCAFDYQEHRPTLDIECSESIKKICATKSYFAVLFKSEVKIYRFIPAGLVLQLRYPSFDTNNIPFDMVEISPQNSIIDTSLLANKLKIAVCKHDDTGVVKITSCPTRSEEDILINAASHPLSIVKFNHDGTLIATASEHGTIIRVFNAENSQLVKECRRGSFPANIFSVSFSWHTSFDKILLAAISANGTVHIFSMKSDNNRSVMGVKLGTINGGALAFTPTGKLAVATTAGKLMMYNCDEINNSVNKENEVSIL